MGGRGPAWGKYRKVRNAETDSFFKVPEGKVCLICIGTFRSLALDYKYASYAAYYKFVRESAQEHTQFLQGVKEYIRQKNETPGGRVDKEAIKKATTTLHSEHKTGIKLKGPAKEFVMVDHWDSKLDGEFDESKVVEETWQGKKVKGIWKTTGRAGVLKAAQYEDNNMTERTEEHSGQGPFADQALETKKSALQKVFTEAEDERQKNAVAAGPAGAGADAIMQTLRGLLPQLKDPAAESEPGAPSLAPGAAVEEDASDIEEEEVGPAARLAGAFAGPKVKAAATAKAKAKGLAAKPSAKAKALPAPVQQTSVKPQSSIPATVASPQPAVAASPPASASGGETLQLDGRGKRLKENLREILQKCSNQLEEHLAVTFSLSQADCKQVYGKKTKAMSSLSNTVTKQIKKIEDSVNKGGLLQELEEFQQVQDTLLSLLELYNRLNTANPASQDLSDAVAACQAAPLSIELGPQVWQKLLDTKCAHLCLYQDFVGYSQLFRSTNEEARQG